jgi:hypothetical protein
MKKTKPKKMKKSQYCQYAHDCDREEDCFNGAYCPVFKHTDKFSSLRFEKEKP